MSTQPDVRPGQVWADNDKRMKGRLVKVERIDGDTAICTSGSRTVRIAVRRFRPISSGYRLVSSPEPQAAPAHVQDAARAADEAVQEMLAQAERRGAVKALRTVADEWRGDHVASADCVADDLISYAVQIESGEVTP